MSSESTLILFGLLVVITPYSGVPTFWYTYILPILGIVIIGIGFLFRSRRVSSQSNTTQTTQQTPSSASANDSAEFQEHLNKRDEESSVSASCSAESSDAQQPASSSRKDPSPIS